MCLFAVIRTLTRKSHGCVGLLLDILFDKTLGKGLWSYPAGEVFGITHTMGTPEWRNF